VISGLYCIPSVTPLPSRDLILERHAVDHDMATLIKRLAFGDENESDFMTPVRGNPVAPP
jgi:hypothetical protein